MAEFQKLQFAWEPEGRSRKEKAERGWINFSMDDISKYNLIPEDIKYSQKSINKIKKGESVYFECIY